VPALDPRLLRNMTGTDSEIPIRRPSTHGLTPVARLILFLSELWPARGCWGAHFWPTIGVLRRFGPAPIYPRVCAKSTVLHVCGTNNGQLFFCVFRLFRGSIRDLRALNSHEFRYAI